MTKIASLIRPNRAYSNVTRQTSSVVRIVLKTALISGEAVSVTQVVQSNDYNKNDVKDPKTMLIISEVGKPLRDRRLTGGWLVLRQLNLEYERNQKDGTRIKNRLQQGLFELFSDLGFKNDWLYNSHASAMVGQLNV